MADFDPFTVAPSSGVRQDTGKNPDPRQWDRISKSKIKRAERRVRDSVITQVGENDWVVEGHPKLGDHYSEYKVHRTIGNNGKMRHVCACQQHVGGQYRSMCTHIIATLIAVKENKCLTLNEQETSSSLVPSAEPTPSDTSPPMAKSSGSVSDADTRLSKGLDQLTQNPSPKTDPSSPSSTSAPSPTASKPKSRKTLRLSNDSTSPITSGQQEQSSDTHSTSRASGVTPRELPGRYPSWVTEFRDFQPRVAQEVVDALKDNNLVFLDGPTGSGKSLIGYMVGELWAQQIQRAPQSVYLCNDKALQRQFLADFKEVGARTMMGRANYMPQITSDDWGNPVTCDDCNKRNDNCTFCPDVQACSYTVAKEAAKEASVAVLNYAYFLREANSSHSTFSGRELVIADECDVLEGIMLSYAEVVYSQQLRRQLNLGQPKVLENATSQAEWLEQVVLPAIENEIVSMGKVPGSDVKRTRQIKRLRTKKNETIGLMNGIEEGNWVMTGYKTSRTRGERQGPLIFKPIRIDEMAGQMLFRHGRKFVMMSATIVSPEELADTLGWTSNYAVVKAPMIFPVENRPVYVSAVGNMSRKTVEADAPLVVNAVKHILNEFPDERAIIHTVSYDLTQRIQRGLEGCGRRVMTYRDSAHKEEILAEFKGVPSAVLIGPSIGRGTDFKGDAARINIVCKVPYPYLGDKQVSARTYDGAAGNLWYRTKTVRELVQMTGRTTRSEDDWSLTYVLDGQAMKLLRENKELFPEWWREAATTRATPEMFMRSRHLPRPEFLETTDQAQ